MPLARAAHSFAVTLCALRARKAEPSAAANPARAVGPAAGNFFLTDWLAAAAVAAASEVGGQLRQLVDRNSTGMGSDLAALAKEAHEKICPYSHATRGNVDVKIEVKGA